MEEYEDQEADRAHTAAVRQRVGLLLAFYCMKTMQHDMDDASTFAASRTLPPVATCNTPTLSFTHHSCTLEGLTTGACAGSVSSPS